MSDSQVLECTDVNRLRAEKLRVGILAEATRMLAKREALENRAEMIHARIRAILEGGN